CPKNLNKLTQNSSSDKVPPLTNMSEVVAKRIKKMGSKIINRIVKKSFLVPMILFSSNSTKSGTPTTIFLAIYFPKIGPATTAVGKPTIKPNPIIQPIGTSKVGATATGPGVGGINEWPTAIPANKGMAKCNNDKPDRLANA